MGFPSAFFLAGNGGGERIGRGDSARPTPPQSKEEKWMAHECPECGELCYCGGDIDDCLLNIHADVMGCTHCPIDGEEPDGEYFDDYPEWEEREGNDGILSERNSG